MDLTWVVLIACWLCTSSIIASIAHASRMSFFAWFFATMCLPVIIPVLLIEWTVMHFRDETSNALR
jgi:hypothetical protein